MRAVVADIDARLRALGQPERAVKERSYLKSDLEHYGATVPAIRSVALLLPLRRGTGDFDRFGRYADAMLDEKEFFVAKAIGWVLRDTGRKRPDLVYEWLLPRAGRASPVTLREALKPLSEAQRLAILAART